MFKYWRLALKNITRYKRRTFLVISMIASGVIVSIFLEGLLENMRWGWLQAIIHTQTGHIQIMPKGYLKRELMSPLDLLISSPQKIEKFLDKQKEVLSYTKRLNFSGMIATEEKTSIFNGIGIDPANEYEVFSLLKETEKGKHLSWNTPDGVVIGEKLGENLELNLGSIVTLVSNTLDGAMNAVNVEVTGIFKSGQPEVDSMIISVPLSKAYQLLDIKDKVSNIICVIDDINDVPKFKRKIERFIKSNLKDQELEVHSWDELATTFKQVMAMQTFTVKIIEAIIFFLIGIGICTVMLMSVFERTREIGTMTAFGIKRSEIISLFLNEAFIVGIIGGLLGVIVGSLITLIVYFIGIPFTPPGTERVIYMRPFLVPEKILLVFLLVNITTIIGGLYPSLWASKIKPIEALRFV